MACLRMRCNCDKAYSSLIKVVDGILELPNTQTVRSQPDAQVPLAPSQAFNLEPPLLNCDRCARARGPGA